MHVNVRKMHRQSLTSARHRCSAAALRQKQGADVKSPRRRVSCPLPAHAHKFDYERSYVQLESYCRVRAQHAEVFHQLTRRPASSSVERRCRGGAAETGQNWVVESSVGITKNGSRTRIRRTSYDVIRQATKNLDHGSASNRQIMLCYM